MTCPPHLAGVLDCVQELGGAAFDLPELREIEHGLQTMVNTVNKVQEVSKDAEDHHFQVWAPVAPYFPIDRSVRYVRYVLAVGRVHPCAPALPYTPSPIPSHTHRPHCQMTGCTFPHHWWRPWDAALSSAELS